MHVAGAINTSTDFLSRVKFTPKERIEHKIREDILTLPMIKNHQKINTADEEQQSFLLEVIIETEEEIMLCK